MTFASDAERMRYWITKGLCPECGHRGFVIGPRGGQAINIECADLACRARYNVTFYAGTAVYVEALAREHDGGIRWPSSPPLARSAD